MKVKLLVCFLSVCCIASVDIMETNFFRTPHIKKWGTLTWNDFQGIPVPFSKFDAAISSTVELSYDSVAGRYRAYAVQNNMRSWVRSDTSAYGLRHEQYHFNITELHARRLNEYIDGNPDGNGYLFELRRGSLMIDLSAMQTQYDDETDHSVRYSKQKHWEYKIDSMLNYDKGWVSDPFSGARAFFPDTPTLTRRVTEAGFAYRKMQLQKYDAIFSLESYQRQDVNSSIIDDLKTYFEGVGDNVIVHSIQERLGEPRQVHIVTKDSSGFVTHGYWIFNDGYLCAALVKPPKDLSDSAAFNAMVYSFLNSFSVEDTDSYWISEFTERDEANTLMENAHAKKGSKTCVVQRGKSNTGMHRGPIFLFDGSMIFAHDIMSSEPAKAHESHQLVIGDDMFRFPADSTIQIYHVPAEKIPQGSFDVQIGYVMSENTNGCGSFFSTTLTIEKPHDKSQ